ncbi:hypothetical protein DCMF_04240 [Candidatus Formimonas warabiya]|uniref:Uncharacterized protein n=2 Tax=Formimonas warabiya TaxID=1761012 RepID=A0A3G1L0P1_FORW1|nr:hypothetical protein DCMF_04240 [Candidatus Formimonas warabiya]
MHRAVTAVFFNYTHGAKALKEIETKRLANSEISLVRKISGDFAAETAEELNPLADLKWVLIGAGTIDIPDFGKISAGGPLAGLLQREPENGISRALMHYGLSEERADFYTDQVDQGKTLVLIETNQDKVNQVANILTEQGGEFVEKWGKNLGKPLYPHH